MISAGSFPSAAGWSSMLAAALNLTGLSSTPMLTIMGSIIDGAGDNFGYSMAETTYYDGDRWPVR